MIQLLILAGVLLLYFFFYYTFGALAVRLVPASAGTSNEGAFMAVIPAVGCVGHCTYTRIDSLFYYRAKGFRLQAGMSAVAFYRTAKI